MNLTDPEWHTLLHAIVNAEKHVDCLAKRDGWHDSEAAMAKANYGMLFTEVFKAAPASVRTEMLNMAKQRVINKP